MQLCTIQQLAPSETFSWLSCLPVCRNGSGFANSRHIFVTSFVTSNVTNSFCCFLCLQYLPSFADSCFPSAYKPICYQYSRWFVTSVAGIKTEFSLPGTPIIVLRALFLVSVLSLRELFVGEGTAQQAIMSPNFILFFPFIVDNKFSKLNQQNAQCFSLGAYIYVTEY
jgi:hypothetical protein